MTDGYKTSIQAAVAYLIGKGIIKRDTDVINSLGMSKGTFSAYKNGKTEPSENFIKKFENFYGLSLADFEEKEKGDQEKSYQEQRYEQKLNGGNEDVPVFVGNTRLGIVKVYSDDPEMQKPVANLPAGLFPGCNHAEKVSGDSMYPLIINQGYVVGKIIDKRGIVWGEKYGIHTVYGMSVVKFLHPAATPEKVRMVSYNKSIPDQEIALDDVTFLFRVMFILNPA